MDRLLRDLHTTVRADKSCGEDWLEPIVLAGYRAAYQQIITIDNRRHPPPTVRTGKRGAIKKTPAANLLVRLDREREQVLRFAHDFRVPFDNNQAERDIRMIKLQQKISGCWRTMTGAEQLSPQHRPQERPPGRPGPHRTRRTRPLATSPLNSHPHGGSLHVS